MAQRQTITLIDDLDSSLADETVEFSLDGKHYEIDLTTEHAKELRAAIEQYVGKARKSSARSTSARSKTGATATRAYDIAAVRAWAASKKIQLPKRGRIPRDVIEQFHASGF